MDFYRQKKSLTKDEVILPELLTVQKVTNNKNLTIDNVKGEEFNCWGFTAYSFKWLSSLMWFEVNEMEYCLGTFTREVKKPRIGDIVVFRSFCDGELLHTAILTDLTSNKIIHKPGYLDLEVNTVKGALEIYDDADEITFRRPLKDKKFKHKAFCKSPYNEQYDCYGEQWDTDFDD